MTGFDKILVVTGEPRSGTSLMMQTLAAMGVPVAGNAENPQPFPGFHGGALSREERAKELNPHGYFEVPGVVMRGVRETPERFYGQALKVVVSGLIHTPLEHVGKVILCLRDPREIAQSQSRLVSNVSVSMDTTDSGKAWDYMPSAMKITPQNYLRHIGSFALWTMEQPLWNWAKVLVVDYADMMTDPADEYRRIAEFAGVEPSGMPVVDGSLYRSNPAEWEGPGGELAQRLYLALKPGAGDIESIADDLRTWLETDCLERVQWIDDVEFGTWLAMGPSLWRSMQANNKGLRDKLRPTSPTPEKCPYFSYAEGEEYFYLVRRPADIGDLKRLKIRCGLAETEPEHGEILKTAAECLTCWKSRARHG